MSMKKILHITHKSCRTTQMKNLDWLERDYVIVCRAIVFLKKCRSLIVWDEMHSENQLGLILLVVNSIK